MSNNLRLAIDLGAGSGRIIAGRFFKNNLYMTELHRFRHDIVISNNQKCWDWKQITGEINYGLCKACEFAGNQTIASVSCDSWAQDFGLLDSEGNLFYGPVSYRDERTTGMPESFSDIISIEELFYKNGSVISPVTTLCQLKAMREREPEVLEKADKLLHIADLVHYQLCGAANTGWTMATASQMWNIQQRKWDEELLKSLHIPVHFLGKVSFTPMVIGKITPENAPHPKLAGVPVISGAGHDTAAASALMMPFKTGSLMVSLGTWAMVCCVTDKGIDGVKYNNGLGYTGLPYGHWGVFKSGTGLWPLQQCRKEWQNLSWGEIEQQTNKSKMETLIDLTDKRLFSPENMTGAIADLCNHKPETIGDFSRVILRSLSKHITECIESLSLNTGCKFKSLNVVGGGVRDNFLCETLAQMCRLPVKKGSPEASAAGNLLLQSLTSGDIIDVNTINIMETS